MRNSQRALVPLLSTVQPTVRQTCSAGQTCGARYLFGHSPGGPDCLRDTFAVECLLGGVPLERVSVLLGHSSVKVTERHYAPWVQKRQ